MNIQSVAPSDHDIFGGPYWERHKGHKSLKKQGLWATEGNQLQRHPLGRKQVGVKGRASAPRRGL